MTTERTPCTTCGPPIELDERRTLVLRHTARGDGPALSSLYHRLDADDVNRRFFSYALPQESWFEEWASIAERGGFGLIVESRAGDETTVVAEAGYALLCDGDGELGIAVEPHARGWLGPWLLDALLRHADERGIPNIQALVLSENRRMSAMAARRGAATMGSPEWSTLRLSMSTNGPVPSWPGDRLGDRPHERPRLLVESERSRWGGAAAAIRAGYDVMVCRGPEHHPHGCPVVDGGHCPLRDGADVVVELLDPTDPSSAARLLADTVGHPGLRVIPGFTTDPETGLVRRRTDAEIVADAGDSSATGRPGYVSGAGDSSTQPRGNTDE